MSEFTEYLFVRAPAAVAARAVGSARASALVLEEAPTPGAAPSTPWSIVVTPKPHDLARSLVTLTCVAFDFAEDHSVDFTLYDTGGRSARLHAASEVGHRHHFDEEGWVASGLFSKSAAAKMRALLESKVWIHDDIRDKGLRVLGLRGESWLYLLSEDNSAYERFPIATFIEDGVEKPWRDPHASAEEGLEEILRAEGPRRPRKGVQSKDSASTLRPDEVTALTSAFAGAAPLGPKPASLVAHVDLAACTTPRAWLDAKKTIDPKKASDLVIAELERTVREGRFPEAGDSAIVVREGAAMLLARCIKSRVDDAPAWVEARAAKAKSAAEREAWDAARRVAEAKF